MRPREIALARQLERKLDNFEKAHGLLPGIEDLASREVLIEQLVESVRRIKFVDVIRSRPISPLRGDPSSSVYDPIRAAILFHQAGKIDEAAWQVFLSVHFGHSLKSGWRLPQDVYGRLGGTKRWGWKQVSSDIQGFKSWLSDNLSTLKGGDGTSRRFGNHRKYTSLDAWKPNGTGDAVDSYVRWVTAAGGHSKLFQAAINDASGNPKMAFSALYKSMSCVISFGRIGRFDYLTMIGKTAIAAIEPDSAYMSGATGPLLGARLLFGPGMSIKSYDQLSVRLGNSLGVNMQVIEDALCNWQKSPDKFIAFRG